MRISLLILLVVVLFNLPSVAQVNRTKDLMPVPRQLTPNNQRFVITPAFRVAVTGKPDPRLYAEASRFVRRMGEKTGFFLDKQDFVTAKDNDPLSPLIIKVQRAAQLNIYEDESYSLNITTKQVVLEATTDLGAIHGLETLLQLVSTGDKGYYFPGLSLKDEPRFTWRGMLLDVALHFMPIDMVKRTLDGMAAMKLNVLHLHLCNDQGFRVESKVFPQLQEQASDGLYYTQENIRDIINYAGQRGIRIVPEFVVPAHTTAILVAFPEFASLKKKYTLERYFGVFDPVLDPTNEEVWVFIDKLFAEMTALFPDVYFHIGGDENTGKDWESTPHIKAYMKDHGMKEYMDLQTAFNKRLLPILKKYHKTMMGWDEILQPGVPKDIVIQSWRGKEFFYASVKNGYKAILSNGYYIDLIQPASYHYTNDPIPDSVHLTPEQTKNILGGEGTMWSEHITPETADSRIWPRMAAIAERLWSSKEVNDVDDMYRRLDIASLHLEALGLRHESYKQGMLRRLANGYDTKALQVLVNVIEPLKIYERNEKDSMYTVFSPYTKIADAATPDQAVPRLFNRAVDVYLQQPSTPVEKDIIEQLTTWKNNHRDFLITLRNSPVLQEAANLSENLEKLATAGLSAMTVLRNKTKPSVDWLPHHLAVVEKAKQQGGRCELQVVIPIEKLIRAAAGVN